MPDADSFKYVVNVLLLERLGALFQKFGDLVRFHFSTQQFWLYLIYLLVYDVITFIGICAEEQHASGPEQVYGGGFYVAVCID